jgi:hypothetical protein
MKAAAAWNIISNYEAADLVKVRYKAKHNWEPNAALCREITAPFVQARHYYQAAAVADRTVKPLLLYYGVISLSRGLVLFLSKKLREAALAPSHGLSIRGWSSVLSAPRPDIGSLKLVVNASGSFVELLKATGNRNLLRANSSAVNKPWDCDAVPTNAALTLGELLDRLPELADQLKRWRTPKCMKFSNKQINGSEESEITVHRNELYIDDNFVMDVFGRAYCKLVSSNAAQVVIATTDKGKVHCIVTDRIAENFLGIGDLVLSAAYQSGAQLNKLSQLFAISYTLSMLVRYHPAFWMDFIHQRIGDAGLPSILRVIDCLETQFPQIVVDFLEE